MITLEQEPTSNINPLLVSPIGTVQEENDVVPVISLEHESNQLSLQPAHPLLIDLIFQSVAKWLSYSDLLQCNTVCKYWLVMIDDLIYKNQTELTIYSFEATRLKLNKIQTVSKCTMNVIGTEQIPIMLEILDHYKFRHLSCLSIENCFLTTPTFYQLLKLVGPRLKMLKINPSIISQQFTHPFVDILPIFKSKPAPRQEDLSLAAGAGIMPDVAGAGDKNNDNNRKPAKIPITFPNIKYLEFNSHYRVCSTGIRGISATFPGLVKLKLNGILAPHSYLTKAFPLPNLCELSIHYGNFIWGIPKCNQLKYLIGMNLKLKKLELCNLNRSNEDNSCYISFLETQKDTLEELILSTGISNGHYVEHNLDPEFKQLLPPTTEMPKLSTLKLACIYSRKFFPELLESIPNLKQIEFPMHPAENWVLSNPVKENCKVKPHLKVEELSLTVLKPQILKLLGTIFINVKKLKLGQCNLNMLRVVFEEFTNIKELTLNIVNVINNDVNNGISDIGILGNEEVEIQEFGYKDLIIKERKFPHIGKLTELEKLTVINDNGALLNSFTAKSIFLGIFQLPKLKQFILIGETFTSVVLDALEGCRKYGFAFKLGEKRQTVHKNTCIPRIQMVPFIFINTQDESKR